MKYKLKIHKLKTTFKNKYTMQIVCNSQRQRYSDIETVFDLPAMIIGIYVKLYHFLFLFSQKVFK